MITKIDVRKSEKIPILEGRKKCLLIMTTEQFLKLYKTTININLVLKSKNILILINDI